MTRVLSELLGAHGPAFQLHIQQLEKLSGRQNHDIRLSSEIQQATRGKLEELELDPHDTTGPELYAVLRSRLRDDEDRLAAAFKAEFSDSEDPLANVAMTLERYIVPRTAFSMKYSVAKKILKTHQPKKTMKALGYRSLDSMIKHESAASLFAAAWISESAQWSKKVIASYTKLRAVDFEVREVVIEHPSASRWQAFGNTIKSAQKHHVLSFKELGAVVVLPTPYSNRLLVTLSTATAILHGVNEIRSSATYLKLHQVKSNFGQVVQSVVLGEPSLPAHVLDQTVSWHLLQQYFSRFGSRMRADLFEPVVQAEDLAWHSVENILTRIEPSLDFWKGTGHLALLYEGSPVSCNLSDAIDNYENNLPFLRRSSHYFTQSLKSELTLRYLNHEKVEQTMFATAHGQLAPQMATN